mmetsp:Transcript_34957/g.33237  ORF Transcript_34957/g.33237 Transcript_34957/m.33237 type:complete len:128 (-) Transcript_34957:65-448(-)
MADISDTLPLEKDVSTTSGGACRTCGCTGKNPGYEALNKEMVDIEFQLLAPGMWTLSENYEKISRVFKTKNWNGAIEFINEASAIAEGPVSHHPDIHLTMYREVEVVIWTHAMGGLTLSALFFTIRF